MRRSAGSSTVLEDSAKAGSGVDATWERGSPDKGEKESCEALGGAVALDGLCAAPVSAAGPGGGAELPSKGSITLRASISPAGQQREPRRAAASSIHGAR